MYDEMRLEIEKLKEIARQHPMKVLLVAQQPKPLYRSRPFALDVPRVVFIDGASMLRYPNKGNSR